MTLTVVPPAYADEMRAAEPDSPYARLVPHFRDDLGLTAATAAAIAKLEPALQGLADAMAEDEQPSSTR